MKADGKTDAPEFSLRRGLSWEDLADGRVHRLKRGKHYRGELPAAKRAAREAADRLGKAVRLVRDPLGKLHYVWVQFVDAELDVGQPCLCGNTTLDRFHREYLHCGQCGRTLMVTGLEDDVLEIDDEDDDLLDEQEDEDRRERPVGVVARREGGPYLEDFTDVRLAEVDRSGGKLLLRGIGNDANGRPTLLIVRYRLGPGQEPPEDPARPMGQRYTLQTLPARPFLDVLEHDRL